MSQIVHPKGWLEWNGSTMVSDLFYGEYENKGRVLMSAVVSGGPATV
jgi:hypothetical protein